MSKSQGKTAKQKNATSAEAANEEGEPSKSKKPCNQGPSKSCAEETPESHSGAGLKNSLHGNIFQLKLLMLFLIRGIRLKYFNFELTTEGEGGKFDDLVFLYQDAPQSEYRYRYLQAKHRQSDDKKITETDLLNEGDGDFSLQKYFRSYRNEIANRGRNVQDCIICTNVDLDQLVLESNDINLTLIDSNDEILAFEPEPNFGVPARYKFQQTKKLYELFRVSPELHQLAKKLLEFIKTSKKMTLNVEVFKIYHVALRKEKVIDKNKFHQHFIEQNNLSQNISEFREIIFKLWSKDNNNAGHSQFAEFLNTSTFNCSKNFGISNEVSNKTLDDNVADEEITEFLDKLVFAVNMPNEVRLGHVLTKEVGQHFNVRGCDFQSSYILEKLLDWFKEKYSNPILKEAKDKTTTGGYNLFAETRQKMVALRATAFSIDFRANYLPSHFCESFQYQEETITKKAEELEEFLNSPEENKTLQISTKSLRCTTVKILSALDTLPRFKDSDDGYLLIESEHLERNKHMKDWVQSAMNEDKSHQVLVVIGETPVQVGSYEKELMPKDTQLRKKMIFICSEDVVDETNDFEHDEFGCELLSEKTISNILSTVVTFQGSNVTIESLVGGINGLNEMMDSSLIEEILFHQRKVNIPAFDSNEFEKSLWIDRFLLPPQISFDENTLNQLSKELKNLSGALNEKFHFHPEINHIEWLMENENEKCKILEKVQDLLKKNESNKISGHKAIKALIIPAIHEEKLEDQSTAIITGVAGSGKSTILSRHYEHVKKNNSNMWVIKINLINHSKYLAELKIPAGGSEEASTSTAIDILINFPGVTSQSEFAHSLLKNRLKHSGGVVLMLDGFDEINFVCQTNIICLMKALSDGKTKLDRLIITTRPHWTEKLQKALFQLAFSLEHLGKEHQVNYLINYWQKKINVGNEEELIKKFANSLVEQVSEALKDKERTFIGIPLQCRILAECFTSQLETFLSAGEDYVQLAELGPNYNIAQLYHMLFSKKRDIFRIEKATGSSDSDLIVNWSMDEFLPTIDAYHLKLAIETIFEEKDVDLLCPPRQLTDSQYDEEGKNEKMRQYALQFGLTSADTQNPQKLEFLHRTFAEYMVAEFLYKGFLSEENKHKDQIRDSDGPLRDFMIHHILVESAYEGVRVFLDSMLKEMITTDQTWRGTIAQSINESRPNQLQRFAQHFSFGYLSGGSSDKALLTAIAEGNLGVFDFMLDCLAAIYDRKSVQEIVGKAIQNETLFSFFDCSVEIHLRVVNFLSDAEDSICIGLLNLMKKNFPFAEAKFDCNFPRKPYLALILDFMEKHPKNLQKIFNLSEPRPYKLLKSNGFFIFDEFYDEELRRFIKLQIKNQYFVDNLNYGAEAMSSQSENWENGSIKKILLILQDLKQEEILETLSETVLTSNPELYESFYGPCVLEKNQIDELQVLASNGDMKARSKLKRQFLAAAVVGNEQVCEQMLHILSTGEDFQWLEDNGFIHEAAMNAIKCCRSDMFALILRVVHRYFDRQNNSGQKSLRILILNEIYTIQYFGICMLELLQEGTIKEIVKMKVTESEDGSDLLSKVFLFTQSSTETTNDFERDLSLLFDHVLSHYSNEQLQRFIQLITYQNHQIEAEGIRHSIWAATVARARSDQSNSIFEKVLKLIANRLNQEDVKNLLLHEENNVVVLYRTALMKGDENIIKMCSRFLSQENRNIICRDFGEKAPDITLKLLDQYSEELPPYEKKVQLLNFLVDHAIDAGQLLRLVNIIKLPDDGMSYWEGLFDHLSDQTILKMLTRLPRLNADSEGIVKELLAVDDKQGHSAAIIIRAAQQRGEEFVKKICASLSEGSRCEIAEFFKRHAPVKIDEMFFSEELRFSECDSDFFYNALNFFLNHCNDNQLSEFTKTVTTLRHVDGGKNSSIWGSYIDKLANSRENWSADCPRAQACRKLEMVLENVNRKLGGDSVIQLLLHSEGQQTITEVTLIQIVLFYVGTLADDSSKYTGCWTINNNVLSQEKQIELRRQLAPSTEQFLQDKTAHSFSEHQWIRALYFYLDYSTNANLSATFFHTMTYQDKPKQTNIWEYLFMNITPEVVDEFSRLLRHVKEKLGQDILKNLSLVKNAKGRLVLGEALRTHGYENNFKNVYAVLSKETRIEVCKILFDDPYLTSQLNVEIGSRSFSDNKNGELLTYFDNVRTVRQVDGRNWSMWAKYVGKFGQRPTMEKFEQFMKFIFDKLGEEYLKELVHDDIGDGESTISHAISNEDQNRIDSILLLLSPPSQTEIRHKAYTTTGLVEQMLANKGSNYWTIRYLGINSADGTASNLPDGFDLLASYFLDKFNPAQLKEFIELVTSLNKVEGKTGSLWADYTGNVCSFRAYTNVEEERKKFSESSIDRLLKVVSNKLEAATLVHLLYHYDGSRVVINAMRENQPIAEIAFRHLDQHEKNEKIRFCPIDGRCRPETEKPTGRQQTKTKGGKRGKKQKANQ